VKVGHVVIEIWRYATGKNEQIERCDTQTNRETDTHRHADRNISQVNIAAIGIQKR